MNPKPRITLEDTPLTAAVKMADGNPGAIVVIREFLLKGAAIDPDSMLGGFGNLLHLDEMGIYGSHIWILYKYVCGQNIRDVIGLIRARQLGLIYEDDIQKAIRNVERNQQPNMDVAGAVAKVEEELPNFKTAAAAAGA